MEYTSAARIQSHVPFGEWAEPRDSTHGLVRRIHSDRMPSRFPLFLRLHDHLVLIVRLARSRMCTNSWSQNSSDKWLYSKKI